MIKITSTLRQDSANINKTDVLNVKYALTKTGHYETPDYGLTQYPDKELFNAIERFQEDNDLKVDGTIKPDGETIVALNNKVSQPFDQPEPSVKSPTMWCPKCGAPHGGSAGDECPDCASK